MFLYPWTLEQNLAQRGHYVNVFFWKSASVSPRKRLDSSLSRLTWFVHHAENLFLETYLRLETILSNEEKRKRTKKLDSIFWSLKCSIPMNHDRTHYMNPRGNWLHHRPDHAHSVHSDDGCEMKSWNTEGFFSPSAPSISHLLARQSLFSF